MNTVEKLARFVREPERISQKYQKIKRDLQKKSYEYVPDRFNVGSPIVQAYVNTPEIETTYSLTNFASFFHPQDPLGCEYTVNMYAADGKLVGRKTIELGVHETIEFDPKEHFESTPEIGMFSAQARSTKLLSFNYRHLGQQSSHFYAFYRNPAAESMALIHPQTRMESQSGIGVEWQSNHLFPTDNVVSIALLQINPTPLTVPCTLHLKNGAYKVLEQIEGDISPMGARMVRFKPAKGFATDLVTIGATNLPTLNAKPLVFLEFGNGTFTAAHA